MGQVRIISGKTIGVAICFLIYLIVFNLCQNDNVENHIRNLKYGDWSARIKAADKLGKLRDHKAIYPLIEASMKEGDSEVKRHIIHALEKFHDPIIMERLISILNNAENPFDKAKAADMLCKMDDTKALEALISALESKDHIVQRAVVNSLGRTKKPVVIKLLIEILDSDDPEIRKSAVVALGNFSGSDVIDALVSASKDKNPSVRKLALKTITKYDDPKIFKTLTESLKDEIIDVRLLAIEALGNIGNDRIIQPLVDNLSDWDSNRAVAKVLSKLAWKPTSPRDKTHFLIAQRDKKELINQWQVTKMVLLDDLASNETNNIENASNAFIAIGQEEIIPILISKLKLINNKDMARIFLNSGHPELEKAAEEWAERNGYEILRLPSSPSQSWGYW